MKADNSITVLQPQVINAEIVDTKPYYRDRNPVLSVLATISVCGLLTLAIIDENYRPTFATLSGTLVAGYVGSQINRLQEPRL